MKYFDSIVDVRGDNNEIQNAEGELFRDILRQKIFDFPEDLKTTLQSALDRIEGQEKHADNPCIQSQESLKRSITTQTDYVNELVINDEPVAKRTRSQI